MKTTEAIRAALQRAGVSARAASRIMNRSNTYVTSAVGQAERMNADLTASTVAGIGAACGYVLALVPSGEVPPGALVIDPPAQPVGDAH